MFVSLMCELGAGGSERERDLGYGVVIFRERERARERERERERERIHNEREHQQACRLKGYSHDAMHANKEQTTARENTFEFAVGPEGALARCGL